MREMTEQIQMMHRFLLTKKTYDANYRRYFLRKLRKELWTYQKEICLALHKDLNKPSFEAYTTEFMMVIQELNEAIIKLDKWVKPKKMLPNFPVSTGITEITPQPYGLVLIFAPYNYPFQLSLVPLIGAIAAGNGVVLKPSEYAPHTTTLLAALLTRVFPQHLATVFTGDSSICDELLNQPFDYIFFTGSTKNGKKVLEKASKNLIPTTLELGGKNPAIVDYTAKIDSAAKRIAWGKFLNGGQTCIAPDYILVHEDVLPTFLERLKYHIRKLYPSLDAYTKLVHEAQFVRILQCIDEDKVVYGGHFDAERLLVEPTVLCPVDLKDNCMQEEIFGPILPIIPFSKLETVVRVTKCYPKPLAAYFFVEDKLRKDYLLKQIAFGGGCINDTILHITNPKAPFGGVGYSGMGAYHGKYTFDTFSRYVTIYHGTKWDTSLRYPPYDKKNDLLDQWFIYLNKLKF